MPYRNKTTGEIISDDEFAAMRGQQIQQETSSEQSLASQPEIEQKPNNHFMERFKLGFGGAEAKEKQQQLEREAGLKGKLDIGDIADVAGASLPIIGSIIGGAIGGAGGAVGGTAVAPGPGSVAGGAAGGMKGSALGAAGGQALRRGIGAIIGADAPTPLSVAGDVALTGVGTYVGGKVLGGLFDAVTKSLPKSLMSTIFKQSADDIAKNVKTMGGNLTQAEEVLEEGFRGTPKTMMSKAWNTMKTLEQQAQTVVKGQAVQISNKKGFVNLITDYVKNLKKNSFGFENEIAQEGKKIVTHLSKIKGDKVPGEVALEARRFIDGVRRTASFKTNVNLNPKESAYKKAADSLRRALANQIPGFGEIMNKYSIHINAFDDLATYAAKSQNKELFDLIDVFIMYGIDPTAYLARRGITSAPFKSYVSQGLYQGGKILNKFIPKGAVPSAATRETKSIFDMFRGGNPEDSY